MRVVYAIVILCGMICSSCSEQEKKVDPGIDLKKYESTIDRSEELDRKRENYNKKNWN